ncbi:ArsR/SmtB family transcription factor [Bacteroidota bacterium]
MDKETLFTGSKWDILKLLGKRKMSPLELAEQSRTSMANISQQLRFLEMAGIVTSERLSNRDKGQPRILYSLSGNNSFLISVAPGFVDKGLQELNERKKAILRIWFYDDKEQQYFLEKGFTILDRYLEEIDAVGIDGTDGSSITFTIITSNGMLKKDFPDLKIKSFDGEEKTMKYRLISKSQLKDKSKYYGLYDPQLLFGG